MSIAPSTVVAVNVNLASPGLSRPGFGTAMVLSNTGNAWVTPELIRSYTPGSYATDFPSGTVERAILDALFGQASKPDLVKVGKGSNLPTQVRTVLVQSAVEDALYKINVWSDGTLWTAEYTAESGDTAIDIATALVAQLTPADWLPATAYVAGDRVLNDSGKLYEATEAGTSSTSGSATPATVTSAVGPFDFRALASPRLRIAFNAGGDQDFDITAVAAKKLGAAASFPWTGNFTLKINGGPLQTVTGVGVADVDAIVELINATTPVFDCFALVNGANADIWSDRRGSGATVQIVSNTNSVGASGFTTGTATGSGTVADWAAVTAAELAAIMSGITNGTATDVDGALVLTSTTTGTGGTATVKSASTADTSMGGEFATNVVKTGAAAGGGGPTGTGQAITDGTVTWAYVVTPNFTAANGGTATVTATGSAAGNWYALEPLASGDQSAVSNLMRLTDTTADPGVADDLDAIQLADPDWYALELAFKSSAIISTPSTGASAWAAANDKLFLSSVSDTACATVAFSSGTDVLHTLTGQGSSFTAPQWHPRDYEWLDASTYGYFLPIDPGGDNWRMKPLEGPTPVNITPTQQANLDARRAGYYVTLGSINVLAGGGMVESTTYGFIDKRRGIDWYRINLQIDLINLEIATNKLPNTNAGRRKIASTIAARNDTGIEKGVISPDPLDPLNPIAPVTEPYIVTVPVVQAAPDPNFDATTRTLSGISTSWRYADPVNKMIVTVNVV